MPYPLNPLPTALPKPIFSTKEAVDVGLSRAALRSSRFRRIRHGLFTLADAEPTLADVAQAMCRLDPEAVVVGKSAAQLWGMPLPPGQPSYPLQLTTSHSKRPTSDGVTQWRRRSIPPGDVITVRGIRITGPTRTWADLGEELRFDDLVVIADHLIRVPRAGLEGRTHPFATIDDLSLAANSSRRAAKMLRSVVSAARIGSDSPPETRLRLACVRAGLPKPTVNPIVDMPGGGRHQPDLLWPAYGVCVEYDGGHHRTPEQYDSDIRRRERARRLGLLEVAITSSDMRCGAAAAIERIDAALRERGWVRQK